MSKEFPKYQHIENLYTDDVKGITSGTCYIFPKIDGTNGVVFKEDGEIKFCSRNRVLNGEKDNQGFMEKFKDDERIKNFLDENPDKVLYGEYLIPHTLKHYRDEAWNKFYIFDVGIIEDRDEYKVKYMPYPEYKPLLDKHDLDYIPPQKIIKNPTDEDLKYQIKKNKFLIKDGGQEGEGIVIKRYNFSNKYGHTKWAKLKTNKFKDNFHKKMGCPKVDKKSIEEEIVKEFLTYDKVEKIYQKIKNDKDGWKSEYIPELLGRAYHDLVKEECWNFVKKHNKPLINFRRLKEYTINKVKELKSELF